MKRQGRPPRTKEQIERIAIQSNHLLQLLQEEGITQKELSEKTNISQQTYSGIINQKRALTEITADVIIEIYPRYRKEWLLGEDEFMTEAHKIVDQVRKNIKGRSFKKLDISPPILASVKFMQQMGFEYIWEEREENILKPSIKYKDEIYPVERKELEICINDIYEYAHFKIMKLLEDKQNGKHN